MGFTGGRFTLGLTLVQTHPKKKPKEGIYGGPRFSEVLAYSLIRKTQRSPFSVSIES